MGATGIKIALLADELTRSCLAPECQVIDVPAKGFAPLLRAERPDMLLVESAWHGAGGAWKYKIASYPRHLLRTNRRLRRLVATARDLGIPTVFWNKEDGVHFGRFIDSARHFDHVFTVDANCVPRYRAVMGEQASVGVLPFPVQPAIHNFTGFNFRSNDANFVGSYSTHIHDGRREWQNMAFSAALDTGLGLTIYDRNSDRPSSIYRYPDWSGLVVRPAVDHTRTAQIYKDHLVSLNVNTVTDSATMFSRRLVEILACGGIAVTSAARSVEAMFRDFCHVVATPEDTRALFERLRHGPSSEDLDRAREGSRYVLAQHTWAQRLEQIATTVRL
ncbi:CgeB family protein [Novosphingobium percolationis]|uniref:CgeB family protein n=1 Tax=Novosphingobium percolationis TaxID=2871811 RepID=UPI001CD4A2E8|nr:glycosyltransferase [Novosphingobium percolationis]